MAEKDAKKDDKAADKSTKAAEKDEEKPAASESAHKSLVTRVRKLEEKVDALISDIGGRLGVDLRELPEQPQMHEDELRSTAPVPVEEAAKEADVEVPPEYKA